MRKVGDHLTGVLFDPWAHLDDKRRRLLDRGWAGMFRRQVLSNLPVGRLAACFPSYMGRPTKDLHIAMGVLILQQIHDLPDPAAAEAVAFNMAWQFALDIRDNADAYISERTIRNYRRLVIDNGLDEVLFQVVTDQLIKAFDVDPARQRIDSTVLRSAMRRLGRLGTFTKTLQLFLKQLSRKLPAEHALLDAAVRERYQDGGKGLCFGLAGKPSEAQRHLEQTARDLLNLVDRFAGTPAAEWKEYGLLVRLLAEQCEVKPPDDKPQEGGGGNGDGASVGDGDSGGDGGRKVVLKDQSQVGGRTLQNPSDPDATYNAHKGQGYMMQIMETYTTEEPPEESAVKPAQNQMHEPVHSVCDAPVNDAAAQVSAPDASTPMPRRKPDLITYVSLNDMTTYDGEALVPAIEQTAARDVGPEQVLGDTHYGTAALPRNAAERGVELFSPAQPPRGSLQDKLPLEDFTLDDKGLVVLCPAGHAPTATSATDKNLQARFPADLCANCPLRESCPVQKPRPSDPTATRLQYDTPRLEMYRRRRREKDEAFKEQYRWRAGIEGTMSRLKHVVGLGSLRVRGWAAVRYKAFMGALGLNILRCAAAS